MIKKTYLDNGLLVMTDSSMQANTVVLGVWVGTGSRSEPAHLNGISHVLEHMAFKGTKKRSYFEISAAIENVGGIINAYTGRSMTAYYAKVLKEDLPIALDIISDIVQHSTMDKAELEKEKSVIVQEINMNNDTPDDYVFDMFSMTAFPHQSIGRPIAGRAEIVQSLTGQDLLDYMAEHYSARQMVISASGALDHDKFVDMCRRLFKRSFTAPPVQNPVVHYIGGERRLQKDHQQINMVMGFQGIPLLDKDYYAASVLAIVLGGGMSSRLMQEIREKRGLAYSVYASNSSYPDTGLFYVYAGTGEKEIGELLPALCGEIVRLGDTLNEAEIMRAKAQLKAGLLMHSENISTHAENNAISWLLRGHVITKRALIHAIDAVSKAQLAHVCQRVFTTLPTLALLGPVQGVMPYEKIMESLKK